MLLSYKPLHLEAQQCLQEEGYVVDIIDMTETPLRQRRQKRASLTGCECRLPNLAGNGARKVLDVYYATLLL